MPYRKESDMYPAVCAWLDGFLRSRHRRADIRVIDTSRRSLARVILETGLMKNLPAEWQSWEIYVDVVGFIITQTATQIAFVECKNEPITLSHLSQLLGYSRVSLPKYSVIVAPQGPSAALVSLLVSFARMDVLQYHAPKGAIASSMAVARWDESAGCIDANTLIAGSNNYGR